MIKVQFSLFGILMLTTMATISLSMYAAGYLIPFFNLVCIGFLTAMVFLAFGSTKARSSASSDPVLFLLFLFLIFVVGYGVMLVVARIR